MSDLLMREFLTWVATRPRSYEEAMDAWRSTCPRHSVWEDALIDGLIAVESSRSHDLSQVSLTVKGRAVLNSKALPV